MAKARLRLTRLLLPAVAFLGTLHVAAQQYDDLELTHPAIQYGQRSNDPISDLLRRPDA